jgi:hypothetical protein
VRRACKCSFCGRIWNLKSSIYTKETVQFSRRSMRALNRWAPGAKRKAESLKTHS